MSSKIKAYKTAGVIFLVYFLVSMICYFVLASVFEFPDILRMDGEYRFSLFQANQAIIVPTYYFWAMTGLLQVVMATIFYSIIGKKDAVDLTALILGILAGLFQLVGFIRWVVLIPILSEAFQGGEMSKDLIFFMEAVYPATGSNPDVSLAIFAKRNGKIIAK